jgi:hypothetical protein
MNTIKKVTSVIAITFAMLAGSFALVGVQVEAKEMDIDKFSDKFSKLMDYSCGKRISIIRDSIPALKAKYKKSGTKYPTKNIPDSVVRDIYKKFGIDGVKITMIMEGKKNEISIGNAAGIGTIRYLRRCHNYGELIKYYNINGGTFNSVEIADFKRYAPDIILRK